MCCRGVAADVLQVYGNYYAALSKKVQAELAAANSVAEEALSTMTTVKAHAAQVGLNAKEKGEEGNGRGGASFRRLAGWCGLRPLNRG